LGFAVVYDTPQSDVCKLSSVVSDVLVWGDLCYLHGIVILLNYRLDLMYRAVFLKCMARTRVVGLGVVARVWS
jgi:hypothetical protein